MAHSFVQAHELETHAFQNFARMHPDNVVFVIDTYDVVRATQRVVDLAHDSVAALAPRVAVKHSAYSEQEAHRDAINCRADHWRDPRPGGSDTDQNGTADHRADRGIRVVAPAGGDDRNRPERDGAL